MRCAHGILETCRAGVGAADHAGLGALAKESHKHPASCANMVTSPGALPRNYLPDGKRRLADRPLKSRWAAFQRAVALGSTEKAAG